MRSTVLENRRAHADTPCASRKRTHSRCGAVTLPVEVTTGASTPGQSLVLPHSTGLELPAKRQNATQPAAHKRERCDLCEYEAEIASTAKYARRYPPPHNPTDDKRSGAFGRNGALHIVYICSHSPCTMHPPAWPWAGKAAERLVPGPFRTFLRCRAKSLEQGGFRLVHREPNITGRWTE